jgi:ferredoxin
LRKAGSQASPGETSMLRDEVKELQFVKIERTCCQEFIHRGNDCNDTYEFPANRRLAEARSVMPDKNAKNPGNVPGPFYVDESCIDCDLCRENVPGVFRRNDEVGVSIAYRQPETAEEIAIAIEAMNGCPTDSIGNDG